MTASGQDDGLGGEQPFLSHIAELRDRILRMGIAVMLVFFVLFPFSNDLYTLVAGPIIAQLPAGSQMIATQIASPFMTPLKLAMIGAVFLAMPYLLYQAWAFVAPGLYAHEKRLAVPLLVSSILLFYVGMLFAYVIVFPLVFGFFAATTPEGVAQMPDIAAYLDFVLAMFFAFGIAFEVPVATFLLVVIGVTTPEALAEKRPYVIVGVFIIGMLLTPPDVFSQTLLALPMWALFEAGVWFSRLYLRQRAAAEGPDPDDEDGPPPRYTPAPPPGTPSGGSFEVGGEIRAGDPDEPGRFRPLTDAELEAELDAIEAAEVPPPAPARPDPIAELLRQANGLRGEGNPTAARHLLYRVLEEGNADQRRVARNILTDMDAD